jgi:hypothetical protein
MGDFHLNTGFARLRLPPKDLENHRLAVTYGEVHDVLKVSSLRRREEGIDKNHIGSRCRCSLGKGVCCANAKERPRIWASQSVSLMANDTVTLGPRESENLTLPFFAETIGTVHDGDDIRSCIVAQAQACTILPTPLGRTTIERVGFDRVSVFF